jgi:hypothetical protein
MTVRGRRAPVGPARWTDDRATLVETLLTIHRRPEDVAAVWHPLGFMDLELHRSGRRTLRVHVWSPVRGDYRGVGWTIHAHDWLLKSHVLAGALDNEVFVVAPSAAPTHQVYAIEYRGRANVLRPTGRMVACRLERRQRVTQGECYGLAAGVFHRTVVSPGTVAATFVEAIRQPGVATEVLGDVTGAAARVTERPPCDPTAVRQAADLVLAALALPPPAAPPSGAPPLTPSESTRP